ncbi:hypothetical protein H7347_07295 [Corynebacterium sp. zg-331]|nr:MULTISPECIES: hypothetical protein [unclassified Corynebacterium]MBC3186378.1 hypothetical protein [Corynebacterium sp. zg-331]
MMDSITALAGAISGLITAITALLRLIWTIYQDQKEKPPHGKHRRD